MTDEGTCPACASGYHDLCQAVLNDRTYCDCSQRNHAAHEREQKFTVSGNRLRITRLDPDGNPVGEPFDIPGRVSFDIPAEDVADYDLTGDELTLDLVTGSTWSLDLTLDKPDPELMALLFGTDVLHDTRTWWQRVTHWIMGLFR